MFSTGDKPGVGSYVCAKCKIAVVLGDDREILPYCPCCESNEYMARNWSEEEA
ncbi:hypothetical protein L3V77_01935 [Vibrio sp. DW001]|uniref:hypothetical protein n=1 Tax=Vibrio sp. DW001 TaxID=2912315 RepID=UPI0023AED68B|nr:hypothetical protein [Vibrio sp. DW001]WED27036.1 hypothetical protein L3V77_01935 [Vibrio sp. DW001]